MKRGGGAHKGGGFERKMARDLSTWWFNDPGYLWRRPGPGTRFFKNQPHRHTGDILPQADRRLPYAFPFHVECKFVKNLDIIKLITDPNKSFINKTWVKAREEARNDLDVMLLVKQNHHKELIFLYRQTYVKLGLDHEGSKIIFIERPTDYNTDIVIGFAWAFLKKKVNCAKIYFDGTRESKTALGS